jgi:prophage regulatory protein
MNVIDSENNYRTNSPKKILRLQSVKERTGLPRSTIYLKMTRGEFPKQLSLGSSRSVGWLEADINNWIEARVQESRTSTGE